MIFKVSFAFTTLPDAVLVTFVSQVIAGMTDNAAYATPPVTLANLQIASTDFVAKIAAATGVPADTAAKNTARQALLGMLRILAGYVQITCHNDLSILLGSGFLAQSKNRTQSQLEPPQSLTLKNGNSGQLVASVVPLNNANTYEARAKGPTSDWLPSAFGSDSRRIVIDGLTPGTLYTVQVRALGGLTGLSDWSDATSRMVT